mmetsp:Transcript_40424/g.95074  ORF Transcript_40424/g.95074 Transcript_40424/m.95074 type:complete len:221 (-) Transcript_40424:45-707(-)
MKSPASQSIHSVAPYSSVKRPGGHNSHSEVPFIVVKVPGSHGIHSEVPGVSLKKPTAQSLHAVRAYRSVYFPGTQSSHSAVPLFGANVPRWQGWQPSPSLFVCLPGSHKVQDVAPGPPPPPPRWSRLRFLPPPPGPSSSNGLPVSGSTGRFGSLLPRAAAKPGSHAKHSEAPVVSLYLPLRQSSHSDEPMMSAYLPGSQSTQFCAFTPMLVCPRKQGAQK